MKNICKMMNIDIEKTSEAGLEKILTNDLTLLPAPLKKLHKILIKDLCKENDIRFLKISDTMFLNNMCMITWDKTNSKYVLSFSSSSNILTGVLLVNCLYKNKINNIEIRDNFYISRFDLIKDGFPCVFYGTEADEIFQREMFEVHKQIVLDDVMQTQMLLFSNNDTVH